MLRFLYILLFSVCLSSAEHSPRVESAGVKSKAQMEVAASDFATQIICCRECNSDMLRTSTSATTISVQNSTVAQQHLRHRGAESKSYAATIPMRRAGHVTQIFEFNFFRSSLRVVYYLHALCRLRI